MVHMHVTYAVSICSTYPNTLYVTYCMSHGLRNADCIICKYPGVHRKGTISDWKVL